MNVAASTYSLNTQSFSGARDASASRSMAVSALATSTETSVTLSPLAYALSNAPPRIDISALFSSHGDMRAPDDDGKVLKRVDDPTSLAEARMSFLSGIIARKSPEGAEAFREAARNGTLKIYRAQDVPGVNYETTTTAIPGGEKHTVRNEPTPEIKAMIDAGRALAFGSRDFGDLFLTW